MMWKVGVSMRCEFTLMLDCLVVITNWIICSFGFLWIHGLQLLFIAILDCHKRFLFIVSGIEWILDNDASNAAVLVASEAHAITVAVEGLLGVIFTVATLTDEAVDVGEVILWWFFLYTFLIVYYKKKKKRREVLLSLCTTSLIPPDMSMILWKDIMGKPQFSALQWLIHSGWQSLMLCPLFCQGLSNFSLWKRVHLEWTKAMHTSDLLLNVEGRKERLLCWKYWRDTRHSLR